MDSAFDWMIHYVVHNLDEGLGHFSIIDGVTVTLEWWCHKRKLSVYIENGKVIDVFRIEDHSTYISLDDSPLTLKENWDWLQNVENVATQD